MRDKIALHLLTFGLTFSAFGGAAVTPPAQVAPKIAVVAEIELMNGHILRPSVEVAEGEWGVIDLDGVGVKVRPRRQGKLFVKMEYQLFLRNGENRKDWKISHVVAPWSRRMAAKVPKDKNNRVRRLALISTLLASN